MTLCDMKDCRHHDGRFACALEYTRITSGGMCFDFQKKPCSCCQCDSYRWDKEYEYEYCARDHLRRRLPKTQPAWCPKEK